MRMRDQHSFEIGNGIDLRVIFTATGTNLDAGVEHHPPSVPVDDDAGPALFSEPAGKLD
jgi:hypothetical protein